MKLLEQILSGCVSRRGAARRGAAARRAGAVCLFGFLFVFVLYGCVVAGKKMRARA